MFLKTNFYKNKKIHRVCLLCVFVLASLHPPFANAKVPDVGLSAQQPVFAHSPAFLRLLWQKVTLEHPQAQTQLQTLKSTGFEVAISEQAFYPTPSITLERAQSAGSFDPSYAGDPQVMTFRLQQPLWTGGRLTAQSTKALANQKIEMARMVEVQQGLALKTLQTWLELVSAQRQHSTLMRTQAQQQALLSSIERRAAQGVSSVSEANFSRLRMLQVAQDMAQAKLMEEQAWIKLKQWVPQAELLATSTSHTPVSHEAVHLEPLALHNWDALSWSQSPAAARFAGLLEVQAAELQEKKAMLQPEVYVRAEHQRGNFTYANAPSVNRIFVGLSASTGAGMSLQHQLAALQTKQDATQLDMEATQRQLWESVQSDLLTVRARQSKVQALAFNLQSSQDIQTAWQRQFESGRKSWIEVMNAVRESSQAELAIIENDVALQLSFWRLQINAFGLTPWTSP